MQDKKTPPNVLDELFSPDSTKDSFRDVAELSLLVYRGKRRPTQTDAADRADRGVPPAKKTSRVKKTNDSYSVRDNVSVELDQSKAKIKMVIPSNLKDKISMSKILDAVMAAIAKELQAIDDES